MHQVSPCFRSFHHCSVEEQGSWLTSRSMSGFVDRGQPHVTSCSMNNPSWSILKPSSPTATMKTMTDKTSACYHDWCLNLGLSTINNPHMKNNSLNRPSVFKWSIIDKSTIIDGPWMIPEIPHKSSTQTWCLASPLLSHFVNFDHRLNSDWWSIDMFWITQNDLKTMIKKTCHQSSTDLGLHH